MMTGTEQTNADIDVINEKMKIQSMPEENFKNFAVVMKGATKVPNNPSETQYH